MKISELLIQVLLKMEILSIAGTLQLCVVNQWGTVCQPQWSHSVAAVACRQLGLDSAYSKFNVIMI